MMQPFRSLRRASGAIVAALTLTGALVACSPGAGIPPAGLDCAWGILGTKDALNVAYPDTEATYWAMRLNLIAGDRVLIDGTYPDARYSSFATYGLNGSAVDSITDRDLPASSGTNPYADPDGSGGTYHLEVSNDGSAGTPDDHLATGGITSTLIYRVYVPSVDGPAGTQDPTGGVGLPDVSVRRADGTVVAVDACTNPSGDPGLVDLINLAGPATDQPALHPPVFKRPVGLGGLYANPDNAYVAAVASHEDGRVLVMRGAAPTVPDTQAGTSPAAPGDLRYWSVCTNEYRKPYPVTACLHDTEIPLDSTGTYTIVVSTAADRPATATADHGVAWIEWGSTAQDMVVIVRNMLPSPGFHQSVFDVAPGAEASTAMGPYAPTATECSAAQFDSAGTGGVDGAAACGLA